MKNKSIVSGNRNSRVNTHRGRQTVRSAARLWAERLEQRVLLSAGTTTPAAPYLPPQHELLAHNGFLTKPAHGKPLTIALNYLRAHASALGIKASDLASPIVTSQYTDPDTGETHIYLGQRVNGLPVANANLSISLTRDNRVIMAAGDFVRAASAKTIKPTLSAQQALAKVAPNLGIAPAAASNVKTVQTSTQAAVLSSSQVSKDPIPAAAQYVVTASGLKLAWQMVVRTLDGQHWYQTFADASTGASLGTVDWTDHLESYDVYALPTEAPNDGSRSIVSDPADPTYSPFGWHDTNGVAGAEFTVTDGNNVNAYVDANNSNTVGFQPNGGASLNFDFPIDPTQAPSTYQSATVSQLFYLVNELHDIHAHYGFTEAAGNFQQSDYSGQGLGNDPVLAEDQDGGGTNNANFATPPDGQSPRMQMYNWTYAVPSRDSSLDSEIVTHEFGHGVSNRLTGGPANASALTATQSGGMGEGWSDFWALMFTQKPSGAQNDAYPQGTYVLGQTTSGGGIRRYPYSYNMTTDPLTYARYGLSGDTEVHDTGEIWCSTLWDMNWLLIQKYGYSPTITQGYNPNIAGENGGNNLALKLVMDALKLQPANPSFTNARDAIIAADQALDGGKDLLQIWTAFARRGLGNSAVDSSANATTVTTAFDLPQSVQYPQVVSQSPAGAQTSPLSSIDFTFSTAMDPTSFTIADDVKGFNGPTGTSPAGIDLTSQITGFSWLNNNTTLHITFSPQSNKGRYTMTIGPQILAANNGAAMDQNANGTPGEATADQYTATFGYEPTLLQVTSTTPASGSLVSLPLTTLDVHFNEPFDPASVGTSDLTLSQGTVTAATAVDATTARYTLSGITSEGTLNISMPAGAVNDADGFGIQAYSSSYATDIGTLPLPTATSLLPLGSLIYQTSSPGIIGPASDIDSFTINLDAGQTLTVTISGVTTLQPTVQVTDPSSNVLGTATSSAAGQSALVQTLPTPSAGTYTITVGGANGTAGAYTVTATLNAAQKAANFGGPTNQSLASAQDLSGSFESLGSGASRAAVLGGPNGGILTPISNNFENGLGGFTIANTLGALWHLSTGRGSQAGHSATQSLYFGQAEGPSGGGTYNTGARVAGTVTSPSFAIPAGTSMSLNFNYVLQTEGSPTWDQALVQISTNGGSTFTTLTNLSGTAESTSWRAATPISLSAYAGQTVQLRFSFDTIDAASNNFEGWYVDDIVVSGAVSSLSDYYSLSLNAGDSASLALKGGGSGADLKLLDSSGNVLASSVTGATNVDRAINGFVAPATGTYYAFVTATANANTYSLVVTRNAAFDLEPNGAGSPQTLGTQTAALGAISGADEDRYSLTLAAGQSLAVHTQTPAGGPGQFVNLLDPALALYNSGGTVVASDDNSAADGRNALISYTAPTAGTYTICVYSNTNSSGEYILNLGDALTLSAPKDVNEGDGTATATLTATSAPANDLTVTLSSSNPSRLSAPATVVLPAGQTSVPVPLTIVDDNLLDGLESVTIAASAQTYFGGSVSLNVHDNETATLTVTLPATATEGDGTISGTVTSSDAPTRDITVQLSSDLPARLTVPPTVILKAGQTTAIFKANVIDNTSVDGTQTANTTAKVENWTSGSAAVSVADNDPALTLSLPSDGWEGQILSGVVHIPSVQSSPLVVNLTSSDTATLTAPATVTVPAGQTSVSFSLTLVSDGVAAGSRSATLSATADGYFVGKGTVTVHDTALDHLAFDPFSGVKTAGVAFAATAHAYNIANEVIATYSGNAALSAAGNVGSVAVTPSTVAFSAGLWSGSVTLTVADPAMSLKATVASISGASNTFTVQSGAMSNLAWSTIPSPQVVNVPFPATLTATDAFGNVATSFNGKVNLNGQIGTGTSQIIWGSTTANGSGSGFTTVGYAFTPSSTAQVTAVRSFFGSKFSIWTSSGTLLASQSVSGPAGSWTETPLATPITLQAGTAYRIGVLASTGIYYFRTTAPTFSWGTITSGFTASIDGFPTSSTTSIYLADLRANIGFTTLPTTPANVTLTNGVWNGNISISQIAAAMHLHADDGAGHVADTNNFNEIVKTLAFSLPSDVREDDGTVSGVLNVSPAPASDMTVTLSSSDPSRLSVPTTITVPAGANSIAVPLTLIDNNLLDGTEAVTVSAVAATYPSTSAIVNVHDNETATLTVTLPPIATEGDGTLSGTITSTAAPTQDTVIQLSSSNASRLTVPATVILPAGKTSATFSAGVVDNTIIDGTAVATVTASSNGWTSGFRSVSIADNDNYVVVTLPAGGWEGQTLSSAGTVRIGGTLNSDLLVNLASDDNTKVSVPASVVISAGQTSATFSLSLPANSTKEGTRVATITASGSGLTSGSSTMTVHDSNLDHLAFDPIGGSQTAGSAFSTTVRAFNIASEQIAVYGSSATLSAAGQSGNLTVSPSSFTFTSGAWTGNATVTTADPAVALSASSGGATGNSNIFTVQAAALSKFIWSAVSTPQSSGVSFAVSLAATDAFGNTATTFNGTASLSGISSSASIGVDPASVSFVNGLWTGNITIASGASAMHLHAADAQAHIGDSNTFDVIGPPLAPDLTPGTDSGVSNSDNITNLNNSSTGKALSFTVAGTLAGATVRIYADGVLIGSAPAASGSTTVTTDGVTTLTEGAHAITARQVFSGQETSDSAPLQVTIDTIAPAAPPAPVLEPSSDTGFSNSDGITSILTPTLDVTASDAGRVHLEIDGSNGTGPTGLASGPGPVAITVPTTPITFQSPLLQSVSGNPAWSIVNDFNDDGIPDVVVPDISSGKIYLLPAKGDGTFQAPRLVPVVGSFVLASDLNRDGNLDLIAVSFNSFSVALGNGDGTFAAPLPTTTANGPIMQIGDFNSDGIPDLALLNTSVTQNQMSIYLGKGDGTFQAPAPLAFAAGAQGLDFALADLNHDGNLDIVVTAGTNHLYTLLGNGDGTFKPVVDNPMSVSMRRLAVANFNNDTFPDLVATDSTNAQIHLILGNGNGTFQSATNYASASLPLNIVAADVNEDGVMDAVVTDYNTGGVTVFYGTGLGTFTAQTLSSAINPDGLTAADMNRDGKLDLVVALEQPGNIAVYMASGGGLFEGTHSVTAWAEDLAGNRSPMSSGTTVITDHTAPIASVTVPTVTTPTTGAFNFTVNFTDLHGIDATTLPNALVVTGNGFNAQATLVSVTPAGNANALAATYSVTPPGGGWTDLNDGNYAIRPSSTPACDVAGNALPAGTIGAIIVNIPQRPQAPDLNSSADSGSSSTDNITNFNNSQPSRALSFTVGGSLAGDVVRIYADGVLIGSATATSATTVVVTNGSTALSDGVRSITARLLRNGYETFDSTPLQITIDTVAPTAPPAPTLDATSDSGTLGDGITNVRMPLIDVQASENGILHLLRDNFAGSFDAAVPGAGIYTISTAVNVAPLQPLPSQPQAFAPQTMTVADVTGDGIADVITCGTSVMVLPGNGDGTFGTAVSVFTPNRPLFGVNTADLNRDGKLDLLVAESGFVVPLLNLGSLNFTAQSPITLPVSNYVAVGDLNGDGKADVIATNGSQNTFSIWFGNGDGSFQPPTNVSTPTNPGRVAIADFNRDGLPDLAVISSSLNAVYIFLGTGGGTFASPQFVAAGTNPQDLTIGDFNGDGKPDMIIAAVNDASAVVLIGNGDGSFTNKGKIAVDQGMTSIRSGDFNNDGKLDFVVTNHRVASTDAVSLFLGNGNGTFQARQVFTAGTYVPDCAVGDANGDGSSDLIMADSGASKVQVMLGGGQPADGVHAYRAWAEDIAGNHSLMSMPLSLTLDTTPPTVTLATIAAAPGSTVIGSLSVNLSEPVTGFDLTSLSLSYNGGPNLLTSAQTLTPTPTGAYVLGNLAPLDVLAGNYVLTVAPGKITDLATNAMTSGATAQWSTDPLKGTAGDDTYYFKSDGNQIDLWFNQPTTDAPAIKLPRSLANQIVHGLGGNDTVTIDQSAGDVFPFFKSIDSSGIAAGKIALEVVGSSSDDLFSVNGSIGQIGLGSSTIAVSQLASIDYADGGGNDTLNITGAAPVTLHVDSGTDTLNLDTGINVTAYIHGDSTGDLILNGNGNTTIWYI